MGRSTEDHSAVAPGPISNSVSDEGYPQRQRRHLWREGLSLQSDVYKYNRGSSPLPAFVEDLSLRRPRLGLVAMQLRGHEERTEAPPERGGGGETQWRRPGRQLVDKAKIPLRAKISAHS